MNESNTLPLNEIYKDGDKVNILIAFYDNNDKIIQQNCESKNILRLKRDVTCNTPDEAACFVLGDFADGWVEWKSKEGLSLKSYISKI